MENSHTEIQSDSMMLNSKLKSANNVPDVNTIAPFQDGGQQNMNLDRTSNEYSQNMESSVMNSDMTSFGQGSGDQSMSSDGFGKINEPMPVSQMSNYNVGFNRGNMSMPDQQHGRIGGNTGAGDFVQQSNQFGQQNMRPGYSQAPRMPGMTGRMGVGASGGWSNMGMHPSNYSSGCGTNQPRFISGPGIQQQAGPTPTLNQLLQNANLPQNQRYQGGYGDFGPVGPQKGVTDMPAANPGFGGGGQGWGGQSRMGMSSYQQQMPGNPAFRNQGQMYDPNRRPSNPAMSSGASGYGQQVAGGQFSGQGHFSSNAQRYQMQQQQQQQQQQQPGRTGNMNHSFNQQFPQQQMGFGVPSPQQPFPGQPAKQAQQSPHSTFFQQQQMMPQQMAALSPNQVTPPSSQLSPTVAPQKLPSEMATSSPGQPMPQNTVQDATNPGSIEDANSEKSNSSIATSSRATPTPTTPGPQHPGLQALRHIPSPVGSTGSRSNTPASVTGNQTGSPMPQRTPSSQLDPQARIQSPMSNQGYPQQQMMPPPMGCSTAGQMGYSGAGNKMPPHSNMMGGNMNPQMSQYGMYPNQAQGGYNRAAGPGMPGYTGGPQNAPYANQVMGNNHMPYGGAGPNIQMNRAGPNSNYHAQYPQQQQQGQHAGAYAGPMGTPVPPMHSPANLPDMNASDDPSNMAGMPARQQGAALPPSTPKGALAAAQAAMAAAANQLGGQGSLFSSGSTPRPGKAMYEQFPPNQPGYAQMQSESRLSSSSDGMAANTSPGMNGPMAGSGQAPMVNSEMTNTHGMSGGHMVAANSHVMVSKGMNSVEMNSVPPQAMAATSTAVPPGGPIGVNTSLSSAAAMNAMGPPATVPMSSHFTGSEAPSGGMSENRPAGMMTLNGMPARSEVDVSMANTSSGDTSTTVTQSLSSPIMNTTVESKPAGEVVVTTSAPCSTVQSSPHLAEVLQQDSKAEPQQQQQMQQQQQQQMQQQQQQQMQQQQMQQQQMQQMQQQQMQQQQQHNCIASGSEDSNEKPSRSRLDNLSHPATPVAPSPSLMSLHDDLENVSSPSWPGTPQKPCQNEVLNKICEFGEEPDRRHFLERLFAFHEERNTPITAVPTISKTQIDLYRLYFLVKERGGLVEVTKNKKWRDVSSALNIGGSSSAGFTLRKNYAKYLFAFECRFDRGNVDPLPILAQIDANSKKDSKRSSSSTAATSSTHPPQPDMYHPDMGRHGYNGFPNMQRPPSMGNPEMMGHMGPMNANMPYDDGSGMMPNQMMHGGMHGGMMPGGMIPGGNSMSGGGMMPGSMPMHNNTMMPGHSTMPSANMMNSASMMPGDTPMKNSGMMGNTMYGSSGMMNSMGPHNSGMAPTASMHCGTMMPEGMPDRAGMMPGSGSDNVSVQDPFADDVSSQYPANKPAMSGGMPHSQQNAMPSSYSNYANRGGTMNSGMASGSQPGPYGDTAAPQSAGSSSEQFGSLYHGNRGNGPDGFCGTRAMQDSFGTRMPGTCGMSNQFGQYSDRSEPSPDTMSSPSQMRMMSGGMPNASQDSMHGRYGNQMPQQRPPHDQYGQYGSGGGQGYSGQYPGYSGQHGYGAQKGGTGQQRDLYASQQPKGYGEFGRRDGYNMSANMRMRDQQWQMPHRFMHNGNAPYGMGTGVSPMPPSSGSYSMYNRAGHRMSPQRADKAPCFTHPGKMQKPGMHPSAFPPKKEVIFPAGSVEATTPKLVKRRRLNHKDIGTTDPWRLMMALKSGLIAESTWALDTILILLYDDSTVPYFGLQHLPGFLETLLDHFRHCLIELFGDKFSDIELTASKGDDALNVDDIESLTQTEAGLENGVNGAQKSRDGTAIVIDECPSDKHFLFDTKRWDKFNGFESRRRDWLQGHGDISLHVLSHFESKDSFEFLQKRFFGCRKRSAAAADLKREDDDTCVEDTEETTVTAENGDCASPKTEKIEEETAVNIKEEVDESVSNSTCTETAATPSESTQSTDGAIKTESASSTQDTTSTDHTDVAVKTESGDEPVVKDCPRDANGNPVDMDGVVKKEESSQVKKSLSERELDILYGSDGECVLDSQTLDRLKWLWEEFDDEVNVCERDRPPLHIVPEVQAAVSQRCVCVANILRNLSFIPGNDVEMSRHSGLILVLGRLLLFYHTHSKHTAAEQRFDREAGEATCDSEENSWWLETVDALRENMLVILANISGKLHMDTFPQDIGMVVLDGLLHWSVCPSAYAHDSLPSTPVSCVLSPQRLALETLCKLCVTESNVDLLLVTPPFSRVVRLLLNLVQMLADRREQVLREFAIVLLLSFIQGDSIAARIVALTHPAISLFIDFIEAAEQQAMQIANSHGAQMLRDNPEMMGTSVDMLRRAASILLFLAEVPDNQPLFNKYQQRLLHLVVSQILDQKVAAILTDVLFACSRNHRAVLPVE